MKRFWKVNYILTVYFILVILLFWFGSNDNMITKKKWFILLEKIISLNTIAYFLSIFIEWIQIPVCIAILILKNQTRTRVNFFYVFFLLFLNLIKWFLWLVIAGGVTYKTI